MASKHHMDMCNGPLFRKIILFALPLIATAALQQLFSAADMVIVGRFGSDADMAAVGSCLPVCGLIVNIFFGISIGAGVICANGIGAKDKLRTSRSIHTAMMFAGIGGITLMVIGLFSAKPVLIMMNTPDNVLDKAVWYMVIYCLGLPTLSLYAYGATLLRTMGDTKRPLYYLIFSGIVNIIANYILVVFFSMGAAGVSLATALSFALSAVLVIRAMSGMPGAMKFKRTLLKIDWKIFREMLRIGLPAGIHGCLFAISNVVIQGAINSFGSTAMAGSAAALNIETIIYAGSFSFNQAATSFAGQNMGAKKYDRVKRSAVYCIITSGVLVGSVGAVCTIFGRQLLSIYNPNPEIISKGMERAIAVFLSYGLCAIMDSISGTLRGMGKSFGPMLLSIFGVCFVRIVWVWSIFRLHKTLSMLMLSYPVSYAVTIVLTGWMLKKELAKYMEHKNSGYSTVAKV